MASGGYQVAEDEAVALNDRASGASDGGVEYRAGVDEGMELAVLAAEIDAGGQVGEQLLVEGATRERRIELGRVDADQGRFKSGVDEVIRELCRVEAPNRKQPTLAGRREPCFAIGADVFEEEVAVGDGVGAGGARVW